MTDARFLWLRLRARLDRLRADTELQGVAGAFRGCHALEVGGPTALFASSGPLPLYRVLADLHAVNFAETTVWHGATPWDSHLRPSSSFVSEAGNLSSAAGASYDAVLASHVLEHLANPIGALREWARVLRPSGRLLLVTPHPDGTFDHRRPTTSMRHLLDDAELQTPETDLTHLDEILERHDPGRDLAGDPATFGARSRDNAAHRALHHHVFDTKRVMEAVEAAGFTVCHIACRRPYHVITIAGHDDAAAISSAERRRVLDTSPFPRDRASSG